MCVNATRLPAKRLIPQVRRGDLTVISLPSFRGIALGKRLRIAPTVAVLGECGSRCPSGDITVDCDDQSPLGDQLPHSSQLPERGMWLRQEQQGGLRLPVDWLFGLFCRATRLHLKTAESSGHETIAA